MAKLLVWVKKLLPVGRLFSPPTYLAIGLFFCKRMDNPAGDAVTISLPPPSSVCGREYRRGFFFVLGVVQSGPKNVFSWHDSYFEWAFIRSLIKSCRTTKGVFMCCRSSGRVLGKQTIVLSDRSRLNYRNAKQRSILLFQHFEMNKGKTAIRTVAYILNAGPLLFRQTATDIFPKPLSWTLFK